MLTCNHPVPPDRYNDRAEDLLRLTGFYHASQIGVVQCQKALVNALVERWHPKTHTFHLPIGECAMTLEDVTLILGLPTDGLPVTGMTMSSFEALEAECLIQFGVAPRKSDCRDSCIKLTWLRDLKENLELTDDISIQRWRNWERGDRRYRYMKLAHFRKAFDELQEGQFVWVAYAVDRVDPNIIPPEIYMQSVVWSATVPLVSFECIEWHATDRFRRQFGFVQGLPTQERNLDKAHGEVLTGPKNLNWATAPSHSIWVMHWSNSHIRRIYYLQTRFQKNNPSPQAREGGSFSQLLGLMSTDPGLSQYGHQPEFMAGRYSLDARYPGHTSSVASGGFVLVDSSRSDGGRGAFFSQNPNRVSMGLIEENANTLEKETNAYLVDDPDEEDDHEDDEIEEFDEDEESRNDGQARTPDETSKGYNLRIDPPRRSTSRYTPSVFKKAAKKCKNFVKDVKWAIKK
ncbi:uncharacterized protein DS421_12g356720 [Arachis hypogaea]|nr:uncharacterized protein DS421_12g356720 [Arachis hypogaea]